MGLDGTALQENKNFYEEWKKCNHASYNVRDITGIANTPSRRLILMFCMKDDRVHGCADDHLQVISRGLQELFDESSNFPDEEFDHMSDCKVGAQ